jgi:hypothetical protein
MAEKFESKFVIEPKTGCWLWVRASMTPDGYPYCRINGRLQTAARVAWRRYCGDIPKGMCVLHHCDVPRCMNPDHLFLGTRKDNNVDMALKQRHGKMKLTHAQVDAIRIANGTQQEIAERFGIHQGYVSRIKNEKVRMLHCRG